MAALTERILPEEHLNARGMAAYALADTYFAGDDMDGASQASLKMLRVGEKTGRLLMVVPALCDLAAIKKVQGRLYQAEELYDRERGNGWWSETAWIRGCAVPTSSAWPICCASGTSSTQPTNMQLTGIEYSRRFGVYSIWVSGYVALMRILQAQGDVEGALEALRDAERTMQTHHVRLATRIEFRTARVVQWLAVGDVETASRWAEECGGGSELEQIALARLRLAQGRAADAQRLLDRQRGAGRGGRAHRPLDRNPGACRPWPWKRWAGPTRPTRPCLRPSPWPGRRGTCASSWTWDGRCANCWSGRRAGHGGRNPMAGRSRRIAGDYVRDLLEAFADGRRRGAGAASRVALARRSAGGPPHRARAGGAATCSPRASRTRRSPAGWSSPPARSNST